VLPLFENFLRPEGPPVKIAPAVRPGIRMNEE